MTPEAEGAGPLRVAVIGYGLAGSVFHAPLIAATPGLRVAAIITGDPGRQEAARRAYPTARIFATVDDLWRDAESLDLVVVAAPNRRHISLGIAAVEAGLPVVIDKPLAPSVAEGERLRVAAERAGKMATVFQNRRWDNDFLTLRRLLAQDALGALVRIENRFERFRPTPKAGAWRELAAPDEAGGLLFDLGAHLIDQALQLFGRPETVYAEVETRRPGALVDDDTFVALRFPDGQIAHLWMSVIPRAIGPKLRAVGLRGVYEKAHLDPQEDALRAGARPGQADWGLEPREHWGRLATSLGDVVFEGQVESAPGSYETFYALLRDALISGGRPPVTLDEALLTLRVIEAAQMSAATRSVVRLAD